MQFKLGAISIATATSISAWLNLGWLIYAVEAPFKRAFYDCI